MLNILNEKIQLFLNDPIASKYIEDFDKIKEKCYELLNEEDILLDDYKWSRKMDLNESTKIIYDFLLTIDKELAERYINIISVVDENNEPLFIVKDKNYSKYPFNGVLKNGKINFYYEGNINDLFTIVHEIAHVFNLCIIVDEEDVKKCTLPREEYTEGASIILENLLGEYLVNNNIITENDFKLRKTFRLENEKTCAMSLIIQIELINKFLSNNNINQNDIDELFMKLYKDNLFRNATQIYGYGFNDIISSIVYGIGLKVETDLKYVNGHLISKKVLSSNNSIKEYIDLNNIISNPNCTYDEISKIFKV